MTNLGQKLIELRSQNGMTQAQIAELFGVHCSTYASYEHGRSRPTFTNLNILCALYDVPMSVFVDCILSDENV